MSLTRIDRAISLSLVRRFAKRAPGNGGVPILMYHGIRKEFRKKTHYYETSTAPNIFEQHMQLLAGYGYRPVTVSAAVEAINDQSCANCIAITFDDGYRDFYTHALPILTKYGFCATLFVVSAFADTGRGFVGAEFMTWNELRELARYGISIGSHTVTHPKLDNLTRPEMENEIARSKQAIEDKLGQPVRSFSYPYAFPEHDRPFTTMLKRLLEKHGYTNGVSTIIGTAGRRHNHFFLPRLPVNSYDDPQLFEAKLRGSYNWLHGPQYLFKTMKSLLATPA